jgi:acyl carrier protein
MLEKIKDALVEKFGIERDKIALETRFKEDLQADSLDLVELIMALEEELGIEIPDEDAMNFKKVKDVIDYLDR